MFTRVGTSKEDYDRTIGEAAKLKGSNPNVKACLNADVKKVY